MPYTQLPERRHQQTPASPYTPVNIQPNRSMQPENKSVPTAYRRTAPTSWSLTEDQPAHRCTTINRPSRCILVTLVTTCAYPAQIALKLTPNSAATPPLLRIPPPSSHTPLTRPEIQRRQNLPSLHRGNGRLRPTQILIFLSTRRVPEKPGLARPPAPRHYNPTSP